MSFYTNDHIECPDCKSKGFRRPPLLECVDSNYSGCSVDMATCQECGHGFEVSYAVKDIARAQAWDTISREVREKQKLNHERQKAEEQRLADLELLAVLKMKYEGHE